MNNCILDFQNEIKIPQNLKSNFIIQKSHNWNYSIEILLKIEEEIDFTNLFLILKS
jgi:hypothetical protein